MRLGVHLVNYSPPAGEQIGATLARAAVLADEAGAGMFTLADHFLGVGDAHNPFLECYTSLGFLAGQTKTITLSALVTGVTYRRAGELAKTVSTLDVLSRGTRRARYWRGLVRTRPHRHGPSLPAGTGAIRGS